MNARVGLTSNLIMTRIMKAKFLYAVAALIAILPFMAMSGEVECLESQVDGTIRIYPEAGKVESLDQIVLTTGDSRRFGAFVYMPSLYSVKKDGSIGEEVSACELMETSARGKNTLRFKVLNPPARSGRYALVVKDNSFSLAAEGNEVKHVAARADGGDGGFAALKSRASRISFKNYPVNLDSDTLRILHISNSYGGNLLYYVDDLMKAAGVDGSTILVERLMYSGGTFKNWYDVDRNKNQNTYSYYKMAGGLSTNLTGCEVGKYDGTEFRKMLKDNKWDLILLNQGSLYAPYYENWNSTGAGGYLPDLLGVIRRYQPEVPVGVLLIHSFAKDYVSNSQHWTTLERWEKNRVGVEWLKTAYGIDFVVPYGTAIENLRLTRYNNAYELTGDGTHLAGGLAQYTAGCCYFETIFGPRCRKTVWGNPLRVLDPDIQYADKFEGCVVPVDDASAEIAQKAAFLACRNMYEVRNPALADLRDYEYGEVLNQDSYRISYDLNCPESVDGITGDPDGAPYRVYGSSGILIDEKMSEEDWMKLPAGLYIRNREKIYKSY
ncbi:MAG: DUF4886 domain-containing protein [Muribaculaceae bacterium]|nr:DUF4886 domain-containing protein [Muribaculaceae bacterium]